jgi:hypothetical protein
MMCIIKDPYPFFQWYALHLSYRERSDIVLSYQNSEFFDLCSPI